MPQFRLPVAVLLGVFVFAICSTVWLPLAVDLGGLNLRVSQLCLPVVAVLLLFTQPSQDVSLWSMTTFMSGLAWWLALAAWTLTNGPTFGHPMGRVFLMGFNIGQAWLAYLLIVRLDDLRTPLIAFLVSVALLNLALLLVSTAPALGIALPPGWLVVEQAPVYVNGQIVSAPVMRFVFGGVLVGCVSASAAVAAMCLAFDPTWTHRRLLILSGVTSALGIVLGFSRQSIVSVAAGFAFTLPFIVRRAGLGRLLWLLGIGIAAVVVGVLIVVSTPAGRDYLAAFMGRVAQFGDPTAYSTGTVRGRTLIWSGMWRDVVLNPLVGQGQDAYLRYMTPGDEGAHNFPLEVLHSTGLTGFLPYLSLHLVPLAVTFAYLVARPLPPRVSVPALGILGAYVGILCASFTNLIYWNPVYWLVLAMMAAGARIAQRTANAPHATRTASEF